MKPAREPRVNALDDSHRTIAEALRRHVGDLREYVIFTSDPERGYYIQAVGHDKEGSIVLHAEAVSDEFLEPQDQLGRSGADTLRGLGWQDPSSESKSLEDPPNWWREFVIASAEDVDGIAETLLATLRDAYGYEGSELDVELGEPLMSLEELSASPALKQLVATLRDRKSLDGT